MWREDVAATVHPGMQVLDLGCGDGSLSRMIVDRGALAVGVDISPEKIERAREGARAAGQEEKTEFLVADAEALPFTDNSFDLVVAAHVLGHPFHFEDRLSEIMRVTKKKAVVVIPTLLNMCSWVEVGGGTYYRMNTRSFLAFFSGFVAMLWALVLGDSGVLIPSEGKDVQRISRFPWLLQGRVRRQGFTVTEQSASSLCLPFFANFLVLIRWLDAHRTERFLRNLGYSTIYVIEKKEKYGPLA